MAQGEIWPWRPALLPDETFSSWFARLAAGNGLAPAELYRLIKAGAHHRPRDLDRFAELDLQLTLAERTNAAPTALRQATFARWVGTVFDNNDDARSKLLWLPLAGTEDSKRSFGQQICPACLREDQVPYLRLQWRLGFVTLCSHHRALLVDRCPDCGEAVQILRSSPDPAIRCWKCGYDFAKAPQDPAHDDADLIRQERLLGSVQAGWAELGAYGPIYSFAFLHIFMLVYRTLATGRHADPMRAWVAKRYGGGTPPNVPRIKYVELLNTRCRHELIRMAADLIEDWPHRFVEACQDVGLASRHLIKGERGYPYAYKHAVEWHLSSPVRAISSDEIHSGIAYLQRRRSPTTYKALVELFGVKFAAHRSLATPAADQTPWGKGRYWKLDGVSSEVRAAAREAAIRSGENVGAWVEKVLRQALQSSGPTTTRL